MTKIVRAPFWDGAEELATPILLATFSCDTHTVELLAVRCCIKVSS